MKPLLNLIRAIIFVIAIYFLLKFVFFCVDWGGIKAMIFFGGIKEKMNPFLFWLLFAFFGIAILSILWFLFKYTSIFVMALLAQICPYKSFASWITRIMSIVYSCYFLYSYWFLSKDSFDFRDVMFGLILTVACIQLCISLVEGVFFSYKIVDKVDLE